MPRKPTKDAIVIAVIYLSFMLLDGSKSMV